MDNYINFIKKQEVSKGGANILWTIKNIEAGFEKFFDENNYYPSSPEIDKYNYLPSTRQIQRSFGGLTKIRKEMNLRYKALNHNSGKIRSKMASKAMLRSADYEEEYYNYLIKLIPELYVHEHKVLRFNSHKTDTDFFIYFPDSSCGIVIDVFYAMDIKNLLKQVRIKELKYSPIPYKTFFVNVNKEIYQDEIDLRIRNRKNALPEHINVCNVDFFNNNILAKIINEHF